jgi:hypothetical protein
MMYPRLKLARNLLTDDGVIFISIDDNEQANLKKLCDEVFGEDNFVYQLSVVDKLNGNDNSSGMMETQEYCLLYAKNKDNFTIGVLPLDQDEATEWQIDEIGYWKEGGGIKATGVAARKEDRPNLFFPIYINERTLKFSLERDECFSYELIPKIDGEDGRWTWQKEKFIKDANEVIIKKVNGGYSIYKKQRPSLGDLPSKRGKTTFYNSSYSTANSSAEIKAMFDGKKVFDFTKSSNLIKDCISLANTQPNDLILDFFSGSGTTAHAVMQLNAEDGGNRKFILVQLDEATPENSEARKAGYATIPEIARERIRRAGEKIVTQSVIARTKSEAIQKVQLDCFAIARNDEEETRNDEEEMRNDEEKARNDEEKARNAGNASSTNHSSLTANHSLDIGFRTLKIASANEKDALRKSPGEYTQEGLQFDIENIKPDRTPLDLLYGVLVAKGMQYNRHLELAKMNDNNVFVYDRMGEDSGVIACFDESINEQTVKDIAGMKPLLAVFRDASFAESKDAVNVAEYFRILSPNTKICVI